MNSSSVTLTSRLREIQRIRNRMELVKRDHDRDWRMHGIFGKPENRKRLAVHKQTLRTLGIELRQQIAEFRQELDTLERWSLAQPENPVVDWSGITPTEEHTP